MIFMARVGRQSLRRPLRRYATALSVKQGFEALGGQIATHLKLPEGTKISFSIGPHPHVLSISGERLEPIVENELSPHGFPVDSQDFAKVTITRRGTGHQIISRHAHDIGAAIKEISGLWAEADLLHRNFKNFEPRFEAGEIANWPETNSKVRRVWAAHANVWAPDGPKKVFGVILFLVLTLNEPTEFKRQYLRALDYRRIFLEEYLAELRGVRAISKLSKGK